MKRKLSFLPGESSRTPEGKSESGVNRDNLNRAYNQVKRSHGAPGTDGMTVEEAVPWLREHKEDLLSSIRDGQYKKRATSVDGLATATWQT